MTGIKIIDRIAKILIQDKPVAILKIATLEISNEYLHIFNLLYFRILLLIAIIFH